MENTRDNVSLANKFKFIDEIQSGSPQIREYYEKFGKKRDLEQYFLSSSFERRSPRHLVDSLKLLESQGRGDKDNLYNLDYEVFVASESNPKQTSPDVEIREIPCGIVTSPSPRASLKNNPIAQEDSPEHDLQEYALNAVSPGTLSASKKLEWDSLGDVGYANAQRGIEARLKEQAGTLARDCQQGVSSLDKEFNYKVGNPTAHSTPTIENDSKSPVENMNCSSNPPKVTSVFRGSSKYHLNYKSNRPSSFNVDVKKYYSINAPTIDSDILHEENINFHFDNKKQSPNNHEPYSKQNIMASVAEPKSDIKAANCSSDACVQTKEMKHVTDYKVDTAKSSPTTLSNADSFEFIPGHIYEESTQPYSKRSITSQKPIASTSEVLLADSARSITSKDIVKIFEESDSHQDVGPSIHKISKLLRAHHNNPSIRRKVVKKIVKILMQANSPCESEIHSRLTSPSSSSLSTLPSESNSRSNASESFRMVTEPTQQVKPETGNAICEIILDGLDVNQNRYDDDIEISNKETVRSKTEDSTDGVEKLENIRINGNGNHGNDVIEVVDEEILSSGKIEVSIDLVEVAAANDVNAMENIQTVCEENGVKEMKTKKKGEKYRQAGIQSAPSTLTYSHYLKKKAESVVSSPAPFVSLQEDVDQHTDRSSYRQPIIKTSMKNELSKINAEIIKLSILKLELERKNNPKIVQTMNTEVDNKLSRQVDQGASGDTVVADKTAQEPVLVYYSSLGLPQSDDDYSKCVPPLELANSSSSSSGGAKNDYCTCDLDSCANPHDPCTSGENKSGKVSVRFLDPVQCEMKQTNSHCTCKTPSSTSSDPCACCKCNIMHSQSSLIGCSKELKKYQKIYDKYQKCLTMKAFVKEYDELIERYQNLKQKRLTQCVSEPSTKSDECCCEDPPVCEPMKADAMTCTEFSFKSVCCGSERNCINRGTSPLDTPARTDSYCQNCLNSNRPVSDRLLNRVRKAFAKEYEDITKRLRNTKCACEGACVTSAGVQPSYSAECVSTTAKECSGKKEDICSKFVFVGESDSSETQPATLSSEEYVVISQESVECVSEGECVCGTKSRHSVSSCKSRSPNKSGERYNVTIKKCIQCTCKPLSETCSADQGSSSTTDSCENINHKKCQCDNQKDVICVKESVNNVCTTSNVGSSEPPSSDTTQTVRISNSTYTRSFQSYLDQQCPKCPGKCLCQKPAKSCAKDCQCLKCCKNKTSTEHSKCSASCVSKQPGSCPCIGRKKERRKVKICKCAACCKKAVGRETTSDDSVVMCLWCKAVPTTSNCKVCDRCVKRHQQYSGNVIQKNTYVCKSIPKSVAYNLIVESSESILEETVHAKPKCVGNVVMKVANIKNRRNERKGVRVLECHEDVCSTDEQMKNMSSLNSGCSKAECKCKQPFCEEACKRKTLRETLEEKRPDFVSNTNCRQDVLKKYSAVRRERDAQLRARLLRCVHTLQPNTQTRDALIHLECIARDCGLFLDKSRKNYNFKVFDPKKMIKETSLKYQKLPEIEIKKVNQKKQEYKKSNHIMASIFSKRLQRRTLRGCVDTAHSKHIIVN